MNAELKRARVQLCRQKKREAACGLAPRQKLVVIACYVLSTYDRMLAESVGVMLREAAAGTILRDAAPVPVRDWLIDVKLETAEAFFEPITKLHQSVRSEALKWIAEVRTMRWVRDENFSRGAAPASDAAALHYVQEMISLDEADCVDALRLAASSRTKQARRKVRKWAAGFRRRWRTSLAKLSVRDVLPKPDLNQKAGVTVTAFKSWFAAKEFHSGGLALEMPLRSRLSSRAKTRPVGQRLGPKIGAVFGFIFLFPVLGVILRNTRKGGFQD